MAFKDPEKKREYNRQYQHEHPEVSKRANAKHRKAHPEKNAEYHRTHRERHLEECRAKGRAFMKKFRKSHPEKRSQMRAYLLRYNYGLSESEYEDLLGSQAGGCAICGGRDETLGVDHDHASNRVRGLLCRTCNLGLGYFRDNPELLEKAKSYLGRY